MSTDIIVQEQNPAALFHRATDVAGVCGEIVKRTAQYIQGRKYVRVEGWQSIAAAYGCVASSRDVQRLEHGFRAIGELRRMSDGALLASAEGYVGDDEPTWFGGELTDKNGRTRTLPKRPDFAIQAMAQTRAISRVCRSAFAFVVVLIDSKLSTTPAEEMQGVVGGDLDDEKLAELSEPNRAAGGQPPNPTEAPPLASAPASGPPRTRTDILKDLCAKAGLTLIDVLAKAGVKHADELSEKDYADAVGMLKRRIEKRATA